MRYRLALITVLLCVCSLAMPARALQEASNYTNSEKVAFAFYKLTDTLPDFAAWAQGSERYKRIEIEENKAEFLHYEEQRLKSGFHNYNPEQDLIDIVIGVKAQVPDSLLLEEKELEEDRIPVKIKLDSFNADYFLFKVTGLWIAIVPTDFDDYKTLYLDKDAFNAFTKAMGFHKNDPDKEGFLRLKLRPAKADAQTPMNIGGKDKAWLMMADIARYEIRDKANKKTAIQYQAPWYFTKQNRELLDLYNR